MILISHRGNISGPDPANENKPEYINKALELGFEAEIDVWFKDGWFLGHDEPEYKIDQEFLLNELLWCHAKNLSAFENLLDIGAICFWHQEDDYTLTTNNFIWTYPGQPLSAMSICVMPERFAKGSQDLSFCAGICSDKIEEFREFKK